MRLILVFGGAWCGLFATEFSYKETSKLTGENPVVSTVAADEHRMVRIGPARAEIVDLDKQTVTSIDYAKKQYSVITFAQLKKAELPLKSTVTKTGGQKEISNFNTYEAIVKIQGGAQTLSSDMWLVPGISGYEVIQAIHRLGLPPGQGPLMAELWKEASKLTGIPLRQVISITGSGKPVEMTVEVGSLSGAHLDPSKFAVPKGFRITAKP